jgi:hypothetical protein
MRKAARRLQYAVLYLCMLGSIRMAADQALFASRGMEARLKKLFADFLKNVLGATMQGISYDIDCHGQREHKFDRQLSICKQYLRCSARSIQLENI